MKQDEHHKVVFFDRDGLNDSQNEYIEAKYT